MGRFAKTSAGRGKGDMGRKRITRREQNATATEKKLPECDRTSLTKVRLLKSRALAEKDTNNHACNNVTSAGNLRRMEFLRITGSARPVAILLQINAVRFFGHYGITHWTAESEEPTNPRGAAPHPIAWSLL
jgi:hypothetical protein